MADRGQAELPRQADEARAIVDKLYRAIQQQWPEFKAREGQRQMIGAVLDTMLNARTKATPCDGANLALIEAPTGTGKTLSYLLAAYAASVVLDKKVIVSTATVALQEQLHSKDLPRLAALAGADFTFDLLKGRQMPSHMSGKSVNQVAWSSCIGPQVPQATQHVDLAPRQHRPSRGDVGQLAPARRQIAQSRRLHQLSNRLYVHTNKCTKRV